MQRDATVTVTRDATVTVTRDATVTVTRDSRVSHNPLPLPPPACPDLTSVSSHFLHVAKSQIQPHLSNARAAEIGIGGDVA